MLEERPLSWYKALSHQFQAGKPICWRTIPEKLSLKKIHLRWMSHALSINRKSERVSYSKLLLTALTEEKASGFPQMMFLAPFHPSLLRGVCHFA
jgi:hypothetical protein